MPTEAHDLVTLVPLAIIGITGIVRWALRLRGSRGRIRYDSEG